MARWIKTRSNNRDTVLRQLGKECSISLSYWSYC